MKIDPYYQLQKCRPMTLVSENIKLMQIFAGVPLGEGVKRHRGVVDDGNFWWFRWLRLQKLQQRYDKQYYMTICCPLLAGNWLQNEWPWMTLSGYLHHQLASLGRHAPLTRCFSAGAELLVNIERVTTENNNRRKASAGAEWSCWDQSIEWLRQL